MAETGTSAAEESLSRATKDRRALIAAAPFVAALPQLLLGGYAAAAPDPKQTFVAPPQDIAFKPQLDGPPHSVEQANLFSKPSQFGIYLALVRWYPGYMSAPHWYETDRLCVVVSGTWWVTSGDAFDPVATVPVSPGSFVHRVARTSHYDGVQADAKEPALIAICGMGPITFHAVDPSQPAVRKV